MSQQINLFNPIFLKQKKYFSAVAMAQSLGLVLLGCVLLVVYANLQSSERARQASASAGQLLKAKEQLITVTTQFAPRQKSETLDTDIKKTQADIDSAQRVFDALESGDLGNAKGFANYFRAFARQIVDGLWLTEIGIDGGGRDFSLRGRMLNPELVPAYLTRLKREPEMQGKSFSALSMQLPKVQLRSEADEKVQGGSASGVAAKTQMPSYLEFSLQSVESDDAEAEAKPK